MSKVQLMLGDCLERMKEIESGSVDAIICDPPYGTMKGINEVHSGYGRKNHDGHQWDTALEIKPMFDECNRILRTNGALILFSQEPYTSKLITQAHGNIPFSYRLTWLKDNFANALLVNKAPVNYTEDVCVFFKKYDTLNQHPLREYSMYINNYCDYNRARFLKEFGTGALQHFMESGKLSSQFGLCTEKAYNKLIAIYGIDKLDRFKPYSELVEIDQNFKRAFKRAFNLPEGKKFKSNVLEYKKDYTGHHPTQKPVALMEDLIKTYTNEGDTVLDFTCGSGSTGVAAKNLGRDFIGIEMDEGYFKVAQERIANA